MIQLPDQYVVKCKGQYFAKLQPSHPHHDGNYTCDITKARWFKTKPDLNDWTFYDDDTGADITGEVIVIETFYKIKD